MTTGGTELTSALVFLIKKINIICVNALKTVKFEVVVQAGCVAAGVLSTFLNRLIAHAPNEFTEWASGQTQILEVLPAGSAEDLKCLPTVLFNGGSAELAALKSSFFAETFKKGGAEITIELMK
jgi:hypothetical protein